MSIDEIKEKVKAFMVDELEIDEAKINDEAKLTADLGVDSLEVVDVIVFVDNEFGFKMNAADFHDLKTFGQFCQFIEAKCRA